MVDALQAFRQRFIRWVKEHNATKGFATDPDAMLGSLDRKFGADLQRQIGAAFLNRFLVTDERPGLGYRIRSTDDTGLGVALNAITGIGAGSSQPFWELYVQLGDYSRIRAVAERRGLVVRLEDRLMDIAVWAGTRLILCVENKVERSVAEALIRKMSKYGEEGVALDAPDRGNDALRKSKYLFNATSPVEHFAVSASGYEALYRVLYADSGNRFRLERAPGNMLTPVLEATGVGAPPARRGVDVFAAALHQRVDDRVWLSPGTGQTALNVYIPVAGRDVVAVGVYANGEVWTNTAQLGTDAAAALSSELARFDIGLDESKGWSWWTTSTGRFVLGLDSAESVAEAVGAALERWR